MSDNFIWTCLSHEYHGLGSHVKAQTGSDLHIDICAAFRYFPVMARKPRIEIEGALYHVMTRGNQRQRIFRSRKDYARYLEFLCRYKERYGFLLFAYVLMPNHVHLLVEMSHVPLSKVLQGINQSYTMYFNRGYETVGHLFQGRYKAILCDRDEYLLALVKYIHLNPVRAGAARTADDYPWSSHPAYAKKATDSRLVDADFVLRLFSENRAAASRRYQEFIDGGPAVEKAEIYRTADQRVLGDEEFVADVKSRVPFEMNGRGRQRAYSLEDIAAAIERVTAVSIDRMRTQTKSRTVADGRRLFCRAAKEFSCRNHEIAAFLRKDPAAVTRYLKEYTGIEADVKKVLASLEG